MKISNAKRSRNEIEWRSALIAPSQPATNKDARLLWSFDQTTRVNRRLRTSRRSGTVDIDHELLLIPTHAVDGVVQCICIRVLAVVDTSAAPKCRTKSVSVHINDAEGTATEAYYRARMVLEALSRPTTTGAKKSRKH